MIEVASKVDQRLREAHVVQLGLGGAGSWAALGLAAVGVGRITGIDFDSVELSNLNRQVLYTPQDIGRDKTAVTKEVLGSLRPDLEVETVTLKVTSAEMLVPHIEGADFVIGAIDRPIGEIREIVYAALRTAETAGNFVGHLLPMANLGPLFIPGRPGCLDCLRQATEAEDPYQHYENAPGMPDPLPMAMGAASCSFAAMAVRQAVDYLTGRPDVAGTTMTFNVYTLELQRFTPRAENYCARCLGLVKNDPDRHGEV